MVEIGSLEERQRGRPHGRRQGAHRGKNQGGVHPGAGSGGMTMENKEIVWGCVFFALLGFFAGIFVGTEIQKNRAPDWCQIMNANLIDSCADAYTNLHETKENLSYCQRQISEKNKELQYYYARFYADCIPYRGD